jgi:Tfp pilus assembly protein PilN
MIKVNLLRPQTAAKRGGPTLPKKPLPRTALILLAVILLPVAGVAAYWFSLNGQIGNLTIRRDALREENRRLQDLKKQLAEYEKKKQERQSRIQVIERLRENQTGPVLLLNHVIHSIPANAIMWLTDLDQKGERVQITGYTVYGESVPDFMNNLATSGFFKTVDLEIYEDQQKDKQAAKFVLVCMTNLRPPTE